MPLEPQRPQRSWDCSGLRWTVHRKQALAAAPGMGTGDKRAEEAVLEPGAHGEIPGLPSCTHPPCACPLCPCQEWIPQLRCGIASGAAKAPLGLGSLRSLGSSRFVFGMRRHRSNGRVPLSELPSDDRELRRFLRVFHRFLTSSRRHPGNRARAPSTGASCGSLWRGLRSIPVPHARRKSVSAAPAGCPASAESPSNPRDARMIP